MIINDRIKECDDGKERDRTRKLDLNVIHRLSFANDTGGGVYDDVTPIPDAELTGPDVAALFRDTRKFRAGSYTKGEEPYTWLVRTNGEIDQMLGVGDVGPHAGKFNVVGMGTAVVGDFRYHLPTPAQWESLVEFCTLWHIARGLRTVGHTEEAGTSKDPNKVCPGPKLYMDALRYGISVHKYSRYLQHEAMALLVDGLGVVL